jgi:hypothetical protein
VVSRSGQKEKWSVAVDSFIGEGARGRGGEEVGSDQSQLAVKEMISDQSQWTVL